MKECKICKISKELSFFNRRKNSKDGFNYNCKECDSLLNKKYQQINKEKIKERRKAHYISNKERLNNISNLYYKENKEKSNLVSQEYFKTHKNYKSEYRKTRKSNDNLYKLSESVRKLIWASLKHTGYTKKSKSHEIIGCSFEEFKVYLESKFESWMNWENKGLYNGKLNYGWDIDHVIPLSSAKTEEELIKLNHYTNLQPLCSYTNRYIKKDIIN
jgi:hypothetical protein